MTPIRNVNPAKHATLGTIELKPARFVIPLSPEGAMMTQLPATLPPTATDVSLVKAILFRNFGGMLAGVRSSRGLIRITPVQTPLRRYRYVYWARVPSKRDAGGTKAAPSSLMHFRTHQGAFRLPDREGGTKSTTTSATLILGDVIPLYACTRGGIPSVTPARATLLAAGASVDII